MFPLCSARCPRYRGTERKQPLTPPPAIPRTHLPNRPSRGNSATAILGYASTRLTYIAHLRILPFMLSKELVSASSKPLVLSILLEGESYGYAIIQRVRDLSDEEITWTDGMLYPVLHRLEQEGLIESDWRDSPEGRKRKYYNITNNGRKALRDEKRKWLSVHNTLSRLWKIRPASA